MVAATLRNTVIAQYGQIRIRHLEHEEESIPWIQQLDEASDQLSIYTLIPAETIAADLPEGFRLKMLCATDRDGIRRFSPLNGPDGLIAECAAGGLAILTHLRELGGEARFSYRVMFDLFRKVQKMAQHYDRNFGGHRDLMIPRSGRDDFSQTNVLPQSLGQDADGNGQRWEITSLKNVGLGLAQEFGDERPTEARRIELGLFAAAKKHPLQLENSSEIESLVHAALYDGPPAVELADNGEWNDIRHEITEQILAAIEKRLRKTNQKFEDWFFGPKNSFIKLIARRKYTCGPVTRAMVQRVLLELGWHAYQYLASCIHVQMRCFRNALPSELNEQEQELFNRMYMSQVDFGGLPLVLIRERIPLLKEPILAKFRGEELDEAGVIHRLMLYYVEMVNHRRDADLRAKNYSRANTESEQPMKLLPFDEAHPIEDNGNRWVRRKSLFDEENQAWGD